MPACPLPLENTETILLGHGSGGTMTADLIARLFLPAFDNDVLARLEDQAIVPLPAPGAPAGSLPCGRDDDGPRLAFTTDAFVVRPIFFPGGDIGKLAVHGTINDLAVGGAVPLYLSAAFILEEGLAAADLQRVVASMSAACREAGVQLVAGDTKVVDRGKGDQVFITTSGIGVVPAGLSLSIRSARPGDCVLLSGTIADHGLAVLSVREGLEFEDGPVSDTAPLHELCGALLAACPRLRCMRDATRGGLAAVLHELAAASRVGVHLKESAIPLRPAVRGACEILGLDPLHVANEGKLIAVVPPDDAERGLAALRAHPLGRDAALIGRVVADHPGLVVLTSVIGGERLLSRPVSEPLPRIC